MAAALYDLCRPLGSDPIKVSSKIVMPTSRQTQDYLLCLDCEEILNQKGEVWVLPRLSNMERRFPLYDAVTNSAPGFVEGDMTVYFARDRSDIDVDKLTHFAMGMFWKGSVHSWSGKTNEPRMDLGPYSEEIRRFLLGETGFPKNMALVLNLTDGAKAMISFIDPYEGLRQGGWRTFFCYVPGIFLSLNVGRLISDDLRLICFASNSNHPIVVMDSLHNKMETQLKKMYFSSPKARTYIEAQRQWVAKKAARN